MALITIDDKTSEEITADMIAEIPDKYQKTVGFFIWDFLRAVSIAIMDIWDALTYIAGLDDLTKFNYDDLVRFVKERRGIIARAESYSTGVITIDNGEGTITSGDLFETPDGLQFEATETKSVRMGDTFTAQCLTAGPDGNVPIGAITVIPKTIQGIVKVSNHEAFTGGYDKESKDSIIERYLEDLQNPITSGNIYHYKKWAKEVTGVGEADIKPLWNGDNTVKVIIIDSDMETADASLVKAVQDYIDPYTEDENGNKVGWGCGNGQAPIGAYCTVASATGLNLNVAFKAILKSGTTQSEAEEAVTKSIQTYLHSIAFNDEVEYVSYARIGMSILSSDGIADYSDLTINGGVDNIAILNSDTDRQIAVLDSLNMEDWE